LGLWHEIVDSLSAAVIVLSPAFEPIAANAAAEAMLDASHVTRAVTARLLKRNEWLAAMAESCMKTGQNMDTPDAALLLDKRSCAVRVEVTPLLGSEGQPKAVIILLHDLSHLINAEQASTVKDSLGLSPAGLAHEVKNPLTGIKGAAELMAAMFPGDNRARQYCGLILDGVNRIATMVEQVLAASGPQRLKREPVNIHQVLHQALRTAGISPGLNGELTVEQDFDPSLPEISGDAAALERVFVNLIRNALDAIESAGQRPGADRGKILRLRTAIEAQFRVAAHGRRRQFLRVEVSDTGSGMTPEELQQLFTPFFTTKPSGTGLGLVLSQRIVALHGGRLWAETGGVARRSSADDRPQAGNPGGPAHERGMTFCVRLPIGAE
jgi:two-component system nitrogen regulation sensor histidine kinase GlnL